MKVKKYSADTLRQALEQIKSDLGENALILGTKQVQSKGLLGFGAKNQVEVTVNAEVAPVRPAPAAEAPKKLRLTDGEAMLPDNSAQTTKRLSPRHSLMNMLATRTGGNAAAAVTEPDELPEEQESRPAKPTPEYVELAETAPQVIHRPRPVTKATPVAAAEESAASSQMLKEFSRLRSELREVKFSLHSLVAQQVSNSSLADICDLQDLGDSPLRDTISELTRTGIAPENVLQLLKSGIAALNDAELPPPEQLGRYCLLQGLPSLLTFASDPLQDLQPGVLALLGPTGVGKTTTIAKLAANLGLRQRRRVELLTLDTYRIAAVDQLKTYAEIMGIGCHVVRSVLELDALVNRFAGSATVLIDTAGRSPNELSDQIGLADYFQSNPQIVKALTLAATLQPADALLAAHRFGVFGVSRLVVTKFDETAQAGNVVNWASEMELSLLYLCAGQRVPEDLEVATSTALTTHLMRHFCNRTQAAAA
jgi:flagellar biosynthesis protein FlhF